MGAAAIIVNGVTVGKSPLSESILTRRRMVAKARVASSIAK
jgi:hypothetical protein